MSGFCRTCWQDDRRALLSLSGRNIVRPANGIRGSGMAKFGIGQAVRRVEDVRFLTGRGRFVDDIELAHQCHGAIAASPHAHARIRTIDVVSRLPWLNAVWMNGPLVEIRIQSEP